MKLSESPGDFLGSKEGFEGIEGFEEMNWRIYFKKKKRGNRYKFGMDVGDHTYKCLTNSPCTLYCEAKGFLVFFI